jgi:CRP-like cAMP-binding protein
VDANLLLEIFKSSELLVSFKPGQTIFREGEEGDTMYVLVEGVVEVVVGLKVVGAFEPVEIFGEMSVIDAGTRSATVRAKGYCKLAPVNQKRFLFLIQQKPQLALHIMKILVERIRWMNSVAAGKGGVPSDEAQANALPDGGTPAPAPQGAAAA